MSLTILGGGLQRGHLCNLKTGERLAFLLNPTEFSEGVQVNYNRLQVPGLSHQVLQYVSTGNVSLPMEFYLDKFFAATIETDPDLLNFKRFLQALTVPVGGEEDVVGGGPPRVLFVWPGLISLTCVITTLEFKYEQFNRDAEVLVYRARTTFEEIRDARVTSDEIRESGSLRASS